MIGGPEEHIVRASVMSRRSRPSVCPSCALRARLAASEEVRQRWMTAGEALVEHRVYWEPYVNTEDSITVDITGLAGRDLLKATRVHGSIADANRMAEAGRGKHPFHDPRLGCLRYTSN